MQKNNFRFILLLAFFFLLLVFFLPTFHKHVLNTYSVPGLCQVLISQRRIIFVPSKDLMEERRGRLY